MNGKEEVAPRILSLKLTRMTLIEENLNSEWRNTSPLLLRLLEDKLTERVPKSRRPNRLR